MGFRIEDTTIGPIGIMDDDNGSVSGILFPEQFRNIEETGTSGIIDLAFEQIHEYLVGKRKEFDIPLNIKGTEFRRSVWECMTRIPYGKTRTYSELAIMAGHPNAYRAVGSACRTNPIPIIIPCHRVISADGSMKYSGGEHIKIKLLELEGSL